MSFFYNLLKILFSFPKNSFFFLLMWWLLHMIFSDVLASLLLAITALFARFQEYNNRSRRDGGCIFLTFFCSFWRLYSNSHDQALFSFLLIFFFFSFSSLSKCSFFLSRRVTINGLFASNKIKKDPIKKCKKGNLRQKCGWITGNIFRKINFILWSCHYSYL